MISWFVISYVISYVMSCMTWENTVSFRCALSGCRLPAVLLCLLRPGPCLTHSIPPDSLHLLNGPRLGLHEILCACNILCKLTWRVFPLTNWFRIQDFDLHNHVLLWSPWTVLIQNYLQRALGQGVIHLIQNSCIRDKTDAITTPTMISYVISHMIAQNNVISLHYIWYHNIMYDII